jgi:hypothetical protein
MGSGGNADVGASNLALSFILRCAFDVAISAGLTPLTADVKGVTQEGDEGPDAE